MNQRAYRLLLIANDLIEKQPDYKIRYNKIYKETFLANRTSLKEKLVTKTFSTNENDRRDKKP